MADMKKTLSQRGKKNELCVVIRGRQAFESRYTKEQLDALKWEAECLEEASCAYSRKKTKKEYIESAYDNLLKKHYKKPDDSMEKIVDVYNGSLKKPYYRANHVYNLTIELGYTKDSQREYRQNAAAKKSLQPKLTPSLPVPFWGKVLKLLGK